MHFPSQAAGLGRGLSEFRRNLTQTVYSDSTRQKHLGAFYTPTVMADFLVDWSVREADDTVLDPSFGGLVFLHAAKARLAKLGSAEPSKQLFGIDIDDYAFAEARDFAASGTSLIQEDFLELPSTDTRSQQVTAVVGNPPYVRYQLYDGRKGKAIADAHGVKITRLASSWVPMLIHATDFVEAGGRLAQVLPAEMVHAQYASDVMRFICDSFALVEVVMFNEHVFPGAQEEVVLLLCDGKGNGPCESIKVRSAANMAALQSDFVDTTSIDVDAGHKLLAGLIDPDALAVYDEIRSSDAARYLRDLARVDIGAVTGANSFFVRKLDEVAHIDPTLLRRAVSKATHVPGARIADEDFARLDARGAATRMIVIDPLLSELPSGVDALIKSAEEDGLHERYKCRIRSPWYSLPTSQVADAPPLLLTYMASDFPRLVSNEAGALNTNTVHGVRLHNGTDPRGLAASFYTSLTLLSAELVGRSYGGGVLKLEPTEAEKLVLARPSREHSRFIDDVDRLLRSRQHEELQTLVDQKVLIEGLGVAPTEVAALRAAGDLLRNRRRSRSKRSN